MICFYAALFLYGCLPLKYLRTMMEMHCSGFFNQAKKQQPSILGFNTLCWIGWFMGYFTAGILFSTLKCCCSELLLVQLWLIVTDRFFLVPPQNRPSVITCASANNRNCNLSHCPIAHSGCASAMPTYRRPASSKCAPCAAPRTLGEQHSLVTFHPV